MKGKFDWRAAYFHLVSFIAIIFLLIAGIEGGRGVLRMVFPELSMRQNEWTNVESFEHYKRTAPKPYPESRRAGEVASEDKTNSASEAELRMAWEEYRHTAVEAQKRRGLWNLMESLVTIVIAMPILWWHRRGARRLNEFAGETVPET